ncbi:MAG: hypothetical protein F4Y75_06550 [Acidimicrobiia bacterium]|nr:hypothetical protein [Acidimicrobiia bacterium]MYD04241.1 hypothetical protein [Acidimicrobiia bacterium]MYF26396.1 hypothetical protein [Acidimicrobiia bacterium]
MLRPLVVGGVLAAAIWFIFSVDDSPTVRSDFVTVPERRPVTTKPPVTTRPQAAPVGAARRVRDYMAVYGIGIPAGLDLEWAALFFCETLADAEPSEFGPTIFAAYTYMTEDVGFTGSEAETVLDVFAAVYCPEQRQRAIDAAP